MLPKIRRPTGWHWCWLVVLVVVEYADAGFTVTDLGVFAPNQPSIATAVNAQGATAGSATLSNGSNVAVESTVGGVFGAINAGFLAGSNTSSAAAINGRGDVAGTFFDISDNHYHAFRTANGLAIDLGSFSGAKFGGADSWGVAINASGEVLGSARLKDGSDVAFRASSGGVVSAIGLPGGSAVGQASGLNDKGTAVGSYLNAQGVSRVFTAGEGAAGTDLLARFSTSGFGLNSYGSAINNRGDVAGFGDFNGQFHAFFASAGGTFTDIGVGNGFSSSVAIGINNLGQVVGRMDDQGSNSRAMLWDSKAGLFDVNTLLAPEDRNWTLTTATGINDGDQISGQGYLDGQLHGFLLTPTPGSSLFAPSLTVPAPPSVWMAAAGLLMVGGWRRFKRGRTADPDAA